MDVSTKDPVKLSVVVVAWNSWPDLERCLRAIDASSFRDLEVIVIDNASADDTAKRLPLEFPRVRLEANSANLGHTRGVNQGIALARGRLVLVIDADAFVDRTAIERLVAFLDARPDAALVAPRLYSEDGSIQESAKRLPTVINGLFGRYSTLTRLFPNNRFSSRYLERGQVSATEPFQTEHLSSACVMFRRNLVDKIGPWDEGYRGYWVDADWCMAALRSGAKAYCIPRATAIHRESYSRTKKKTPNRVWMFHMGAYRFYRKWHTRGTLDPRAIFAWLALAARAALIIAGNAFRRSAPQPIPAPEFAGKPGGKSTAV